MTAEKALVWLLRLIGAILCLALFFVFQPESCMASNHERMGLGSLRRP